MNNYKFKKGERVYVKLTEDLYGEAIILGCATTGAPIIGCSYIIKPKFKINSLLYPFDVCTAFECQLKKI